MAFPHLVKNTFFQVFAKAVSVVGGIVLAYVLGQKFGESGYGVYTFVLSFVLFFGNLSDWGTPFIAIREASKAEAQKRPEIFSTIVLIRLLLSVVAFVLINILVRANPSWSVFSTSVTIASFVLILLSLKTSFSIIFQTNLRFDYTAFVEVLATTVFVCTSVFFVFNGGGVNHVLFSWVLGTFLGAAVGLWLSKIFTHPLLFNKKIAGRLFKEALPTGALLAVSTLYNRADILILQHFHTSTDVGIYGMAYKVYETAVFGASYIMNSMFPLLSKMYFSGNVTAQLRAYFRRSFLGLFVAGIVVAFLAFAAAPYLPVVFRGKFDLSIVPLRVLSFALVFSYLNHLIGYALIAFGRQRPALLIAVIALFFNISLNLLLVPRFSFTASAYLTIATEALVLLLSGLVVLRLFSNEK